MDNFDGYIAEIYREMEQELIASMQRNLGLHIAEEQKVGFKYPQWQAEKLKELKRFQRENERIIGAKVSGLPDAVRDQMIEELNQGSAHELKRYREALKKGYKPAKLMKDSFFKVNDNKVTAMIDALNNDLQRANTAVLRMINDQYRSTIFKAGMFVSNGVYTEEKAVDKAIQEFAVKGLNCIEYRDGRRVNIADYASMAVRTANQRAYMVGEGEFRKEIGETLVIISRHSTSCELCKPFEGKVLIDDVYSGGSQEDGDYMLLSEAMEQGLYHPRCRHGLGTYYPELEEINGYETEDDRLNDYAQNIDKSSVNGIIYSRGGDMGISIEVDKFTPCLVERETGKIIQTRYQKAEKSDLVGLKKQGWLFNWNADDLNDSTIYKLLAEGDDSIQGLIALTDFQRSNAIYVNLAESAPHNKGPEKIYEGVGGHLFALAANESLKKGYGGFLFMDAKNMELVDYYREKFGASLLGMPHPYRMFIDEENAAKLLKIYTLKGE